jgi:hypothetical protein
LVFASSLFKFFVCSSCHETDQQDHKGWVLCPFECLRSTYTCFFTLELNHRMQSS